MQLTERLGVETYLLEKKGLLLVVDQSLQLAGRQKLLQLLRSHHGQKDLEDKDRQGKEKQKKKTMCREKSGVSNDKH